MSHWGKTRERPTIRRTTGTETAESRAPAYVSKYDADPEFADVQRGIDSLPYPDYKFVISFVGEGKKTLIYMISMQRPIASK
jgi:hypothetical protein